MPDTPSLPLAGVQVLDFGHYLAGPAAAMMQAGFGADVISIQPPDGPRWNHPASQILNRNKRVVTLDLATDEGRRKAQNLARHADAVIENFRPGVMEQLELGAGKLCENNPGLVYHLCPVLPQPTLIVVICALLRGSFRPHPGNLPIWA